MLHHIAAIQTTFTNFSKGRGDLTRRLGLTPKSPGTTRNGKTCFIRKNGMELACTPPLTTWCNVWHLTHNWTIFAKAMEWGTVYHKMGHILSKGIDGLLPSHPFYPKSISSLDMQSHSDSKVHIFCKAMNHRIMFTKSYC